MQFVSKERIIKKIKKITLLPILFVIFLLTFPPAAYFYGRMNCLKPATPSILIDTSQIDCGCENFCEDLTKETIKEASHPEETGEKENTLSDPLSPAEASTGEPIFVASRNGEKYYPLDCSAANRIKEENRVYYASASEAEADGKEFSDQCQ